MPPGNETNIDDIEVWKQRIGWGLRWQNKHNRPARWKQARKWYRNEYGDNVISVNLVFAIGRKLVTDLYFKNPEVLIQPEHPDSVANAPVVEAIDNNLIKVMKLKQELKRVILDAFLTNLGVLKIGYHSWSTITPTSRGGRGGPRGVLTQLRDLLVPLFGTPTGDLSGGVIDEDPNYRLYAYEDNIKPNSPWAMYWPTEDVVLPYGTRDAKKAPWVAFRFRRPLLDFKNDPAFENVTNLKGSFTLKDQKATGLVSPNDMFGPALEFAEETVVGWEVWDLQHKRVRVLSFGHDKWLRNEDPNLGLDGLPVEFLQYNPVGEDCYGPSDVDQIHKQVVEYNETRTIEMWHKKLALSRIGVDKNKVESDDIAKLISGNILPVIRTTGDPNSAIRYFTPPMSGDLFVVDERIRRDIAELMNFSRNQGGAAESPRKSASEALIIREAVEQRADERRDQVGDLIESLFAEKINPIVWTNWTTERQIKIAGAADFVPFVGANLKGFFGISTHADSGPPLSRTERKQDARELFGVLRGDPFINQHALYQNLLSQHDSVPISQLLPDQQTFARIQQLLAGGAGAEGASKDEPGGSGASSSGGSSQSGGGNSA